MFLYKLKFSFMMSQFSFKFVLNVNSVLLKNKKTSEVPSTFRGFGQSDPGLGSLPFMYLIYIWVSNILSKQ